MANHHFKKYCKEKDQNYIKFILDLCNVRNNCLGYNTNAGLQSREQVKGQALFVYPVSSPCKNALTLCPVVWTLQPQLAKFIPAAVVFTKPFLFILLFHPDQISANDILQTKRFIQLLCLSCFWLARTKMVTCKLDCCSISKVSSNSVVQHSVSAGI